MKLTHKKETETVIKQYAVLGLGKFGYALATELARGGCQVLAVDRGEEVVNEIAPLVTAAVCADVTDARVFQALGIRNMDVAIICISEDMDASILATMQAKEAGIPVVIAKGMNEIHAKILKKVGADRVILAEKETGIRLAKSLISGGFSELFELSETFSIAELEIPGYWVGKNLIELNLRKNFSINVIAVKKGQEINVALDPKAPLLSGSSLVLIGENDSLRNLLKQEKRL